MYPSLRGAQCKMFNGASWNCNRRSAKAMPSRETSADSIATSGETFFKFYLPAWLDSCFVCTYSQRSKCVFSCLNFWILVKAVLSFQQKLNQMRRSCPDSIRSGCLRGTQLRFTLKTRHLASALRPLVWAFLRPSRSSHSRLNKNVKKMKGKNYIFLLFFINETTCNCRYADIYKHELTVGKYCVIKNLRRQQGHENMLQNLSAPEAFQELWTPRILIFFHYFDRFMRN